MKALACVFATSLCLAALPSSAALPPDAAFVTMDRLASQIQPVHDVIAAAAEAGGHAYHVMPVHTPEPDRDVTACCLIASIPPGQEPAILGMPFVTGLYRPGEPIITQPPGEEAEFAAGAWMYLLDEEIPTTPEAEPFPDDALGPLEGGGMPTAKAQQRPQAPPPVGAPGQYQTSEFMIGSVTIGVVLPESTGNGENWSNSDPLYPGQNRQQLVYNKIVAGANFWVTSAPTSANLTFFYDQRLGISTTYEPINVSAAGNGETLWVGSVLSTMGFSGATAFLQCYAYDNWMRSNYGTDWAYAVFVADSLNDADGMFPSMNSAFAYLYGPYNVMTYDNGTTGGQWYLSRMNQVFAHESGHIFGCPDEYAGAGTCTCTNYGYLGVANGNCVYCTGSPAACVMASNTLALCSFTPGHVGWRDTDGDGILDPVDGGLAFPSAYLDYGPTPPYSSNPQITGHGTAQASPWPSTTRTPVCINRLQQVRYNIDGALFAPTVPRDGAFDSDIESFDFTSGPVGNGPHMVRMMATDNWGSVLNLPPFGITIDTTPPPMPPPMAMIVQAPYSSNPAKATVNWVTCPPDPESGIAGHQIDLWQVNPPLVSPIASQYVSDIPVPQVTWTFATLAMLHAGVYQATAAGVNGAGLTGPAATSPTLTIDLTPPGPPPQINDSGAGTDQFDRLSFNWSPAPEDISPISDYFLDIRDSLGGPVWSGWLGSPGTSYTAMGLGLLLGTKYVATVKAMNAAGLAGPASSASNGIMAVQFLPSIGQVKLAAGPGMAVGVNNVYMSSWPNSEPGVIYVQEKNRSAGIRTDCTDSEYAGNPLNPVFQAAGILQLNANQELYLSSSEVTPMGSWMFATPLGMPNSALGGGPMGAQQGVINGSGANNVGLLVQTWGRVTYVSPGAPYYFVVDDGSGCVDPVGRQGVGVRCGNVTPPTVGAFVKVRGVCSFENGYPVVLIRYTGEWW